MTAISFKYLPQEEGEKLLPDFFDINHPRNLRGIFIAEPKGPDHKVFVFPSIGAVESHILVCPEDGSYSIAGLSTEWRQAVFAVTDAIRKAIKEETDSWPMFVEHGAGRTTATPASEAKGGSIGCACIDFPHLHLVQFPSEIKWAFYNFCTRIGGPPNHTFTNPAQELGALKDKSYLMVQPWGNHAMVWENPRKNFGRQFIRRAVWYATQTKGNVSAMCTMMKTDTSQGWNWRVNPGYDTVRATNAMLQRLLGR